MPSENKIEPIVLLLFAGTFIATVLLIGSAHFFPNDGQTFQVLAGLVTGFASAMFMRVKPRSTTADEPTIPMPPTPNTVTTRKVEETTARSDDK